MDQNITKQVKEALDSAIRQKKINEQIIKEVGSIVVDVLEPTMRELASNLEIPKDEILKALSKIQVNIPEIKIPESVINIPKIELPTINVPEPRVTVNVPSIDIKSLAARIQIPNEMNVKGWVGFMGYDRGMLNDPLPVQIRDAHGKPIVFNQGGAVIGGGGGGGGSVKVINDSNEPVNVTIVGGSGASTSVNISDSSGVGYSGSNPLPVVITSGASATSASNIVDSSGIAYSGSNPLPSRSFGNTAGDGTGNERRLLVDNDGNLQVDIANGVTVSGTVAVSGITGSVGATILNGEGLARDSWRISGFATSVDASLVDSTGLAYNGSNPMWVRVGGSSSSLGVTLLDGEGVMKATWLVSDVAASVKSSLIDSSGIQYSGSNPVPITWVSGAGASTIVNISDSSGIGYSGSNPIPVTFVTGVSASVNASLIDSTGIGYSGSNPLPITWASGANTSTITVGPVVDGGTDDGSAPVKVGGITRTTNPTSHSDGQSSSISLDSAGRQINRPVQVRGLIGTAYVSKATGSTFGTETTLLASGSGVFLDLISVIGTNDSTVAINVDLRPSTAGTVCQTIIIPAGGTAGYTLPVPYPAPFADHTWTVDLPDVTGTNVTITALFSKEV